MSTFEIGRNGLFSTGGVMIKKSFLVLACVALPGVVPAQIRNVESWVQCTERTASLRIEYGQIVQGCELNPLGDRDRFEFNGEAGDLVWISVESRADTSDPLVELWDPAASRRHGLPHPIRCATAGEPGRRRERRLEIVSIAPCPIPPSEEPRWALSAGEQPARGRAWTRQKRSGVAPGGGSRKSRFHQCRPFCRARPGHLQSRRGPGLMRPPGRVCPARSATRKPISCLE